MTESSHTFSTSAPVRATQAERRFRDRHQLLPAHRQLLTCCETPHDRQTLPLGKKKVVPYEGGRLLHVTKEYSSYIRTPIVFDVSGQGAVCNVFQDNAFLEKP